MNNFILIALAILSGVAARKYKKLPENSYVAVNFWVIYVALPAIALTYIPKITWSTELILPFLMPLLVFGLSFLFIEIIARFIQLNTATKAVLILLSGFGNTSFLGFPLTEAYYGNDGLEIAILCDQACFLVVSTLGVITAAKASSQGKFHFSSLLKKVFSFPPFLAFIIAVIVPQFLDLSPLDSLLESLGATLVPMALFSVGLQLQLKAWKSDFKLLTLSLIYKLILAPLVIFSIIFLLNIDSLTGKVTVFEASMSPMVTPAIIATQYGLNPKLANLILSVGIIISFFSTFIWSFIIKFL
ncbi:AEC family transporter [Mesonia aestuariivivens]|uniref:AEC family transporter n=1 Tax=Mesonia aestuariivivens TaxID=2796128 RepID=A0ABS6W0G0_9FLAO|nr:AEC family transporter [Mesonia aestuariivivens]MBW2961326.1 AEC family transporter [Mesonia aestuariivivens]